MIPGHARAKGILPGVRAIYEGSSAVRCHSTILVNGIRTSRKTSIDTRNPAKRKTTPRNSPTKKPLVAPKPVQAARHGGKDARRLLVRIQARGVVAVPTSMSHVWGARIASRAAMLAGCPLCAALKRPGGTRRAHAEAHAIA